MGGRSGVAGRISRLGFGGGEVYIVFWEDGGWRRVLEREM